MKTRFNLALLSLCLVLSTASAASAQTSLAGVTLQDILTYASSPAAPATLDGPPPSQETICDGQTGAAHGLCTAYCGAMDCASGDPQASQKACDKVGANFQRITGQRPPCDCPCIAQLPGFAEAASGQFGFADCGRDSDATFSIVIAETVDPVTFPIAISDSATDSGVCGFFPIVGVPTTAQQGAACIALIDQGLAAAGVVCTDL